MQVFSSGEIDDRVPHDLARAMVGNISPAIGLDDFNSAFVYFVRRPHHVIRRFFTNAEGINRVVLGKNQSISYFAAQSALHKVRLPSPGIGVARTTPVN